MSGKGSSPGCSLETRKRRFFILVALSSWCLQACITCLLGRRCALHLFSWRSGSRGPKLESLSCLHLQECISRVWLFTARVREFGQHGRDTSEPFSRLLC